MKKIILSILGLYLVFALMGCGGSGSSSNDEKYLFKDMYLGVWEYGISIPLCDDNENIASYLWKGKTVQIDGIGDFMEIENIQDPSDSFIYLNSFDKGVFYGYKEKGDYEIIKFFDYNSSSWKSGENIICSVIDKDDDSGICRIKATDGKDIIYYDYYAMLGLPEYADYKSVDEFDNMDIDRFKYVVSALAKHVKYRYELLVDLLRNFDDKKREIEKRNPLTEEDKRKIEELKIKIDILMKAIMNRPIE